MSGLRLKCCGLKQLNCGLPKRIRLHCCAKNLLHCCGKNLPMNGLPKRIRLRCCGKNLPMNGLSLKSCGWSFQVRFSLRLRFYPAERPKMSGLQLQQMKSGLQLQLTCLRLRMSDLR